MRKVFLTMLMVMFCFTAFADVWSEADEDAMDMTKYLRDTISEVLIEQGIKVLSSGARLMVNEGSDITYIAYIETSEGYYYYEVLVNSINDNEKLVEKYNIPIK